MHADRLFCLVEICQTKARQITGQRASLRIVSSVEVTWTHRDRHSSRQIPFGCLRGTPSHRTPAPQVASGTRSPRSRRCTPLLERTMLRPLGDSVGLSSSQQARGGRHTSEARVGVRGRIDDRRCHLFERIDRQRCVLSAPHALGRLRWTTTPRRHARTKGSSARPLARGVEALELRHLPGVQRGPHASQRSVEMPLVNRGGAVLAQGCERRLPAQHLELCARETLRAAANKTPGRMGGSRGETARAGWPDMFALVGNPSPASSPGISQKALGLAWRARRGRRLLRGGSVRRGCAGCRAGRAWRAEGRRRGGQNGRGAGGPSPAPRDGWSPQGPPRPWPAAAQGVRRASHDTTKAQNGHPVADSPHIAGSRVSAPVQNTAAASPPRVPHLQSVHLSEQCGQQPQPRLGSPRGVVLGPLGRDRIRLIQEDDAGGCQPRLAKGISQKGLALPQVLRWWREGELEYCNCL